MRSTSRGERLHAGRRSRGIYLISTLLLLTFLVMLGGAIAVSFQQGLTSSGSFNQRQMALAVALSGLQYIQARIESNPVLYGPGHTGRGTVSTVNTGGLSVVERYDDATKSINICGYMDNSSVAGAGSVPVSLVFRAAFNGSYSTYSATPSDFSFVTFNGATRWNESMGAMPYVSMNNLLRSSQLSNGTSYTAQQAPFRSVPGGTVDIIVEGLVVTPDGAVVARRAVDCIMGLTGSQAANAPGAATASKDLSLTLYKNEASGGKLTVGVGASVNSALANNAGLAAYDGNIALYGLDAPTSTTAPPCYSATSKASVASGKQFEYSWGTSSTTYSPSDTNQNVVQAQQVQPPAIAVSALPALATGATDVAAGTWVVWNGQLKHYPVDYDGSKALAQQTWTAQGGGSSPPLLNGVAPDAATMPTNLPFDATTNTLTVASDVRVTATSASGFALLVAPTETQPISGTNSATVGSAQLVLEPTNDVCPQVRSTGSMSIVGNVTGQGALVSTGVTGGTGLASAGDITVIGRSSLDPRSDSGVAIYAAGSVNLQQLSYGQAPSTVPAVRETLGALGVQEGAGSSASVQGKNFTVEKEAVYSAMAQAMQDKFNKLGDYFTLNKATNQYTLGNLNGHHTDFGAKIRDAKVQVTFNGKTYGGKLIDVLKDIATASNDTTMSYFLASKRQTDTQNQFIGNIPDDVWARNSTRVPAMVSQGGWTRSGFLSPTWTVPQSTFGNYVSYGVESAPTATPSPSASASPGAGQTGSGSVTQAALNQTFSGLVYAGRDLNVRNGLGGISINGMVVAYGGDPNSGNSAPGTQGGNVKLAADNISLLYDPTTLGPYLYLFGGVKLKINCLSNF